MKIIRYSLEGFKPQQQTHHLEHDIYYHLFNFDINEFPEHMRCNMQKINDRKAKFYRQHLADLKCGIWCFVDGYKCNQSLNHLKRRVPCWEAEVPDDIECYDCNFEILTTISDPIVKCFGCFIPERELHKLTKIRQRRRINNL